MEFLEYLILATVSTFVYREIAQEVRKYKTKEYF